MKGNVSAVAVALGCGLLLSAMPAASVAVAAEPCPNAALRTGPSSPLPDCRAYEMVSPLDKNGGDIRALPIGAGGLPTSHKQSSLDGERITYTSGTSFGDAVAGVWANQYISSRTAAGWSTHGISQPRGTTVFEGEPIPIPPTNWDTENFFEAFTPDLCSAWLRDSNAVPLTPDGLQGHVNLYRRSNCGAEGYEALANQGPGPATEYLNSAGTFGDEIVPTGPGLRFQGASEDLSHQLFISGAPLLPEQIGSELRCLKDTPAASISYEWLRNGVPIGGETSSRYTIVPADTDTAIQCRVRFANNVEDEFTGGFVGSTQAATKARVVASFPATPVPVAPGIIEAPKGGGQLKVGSAGGQTITCDPEASKWRGSPTFTFRWYRNGIEIAGATNSTYTVSTEDLATAALFQCGVIGANAGGSVIRVSFNRETKFGPGPEPKAPTPAAPGGNGGSGPKGVSLNQTQLYDLHEGELKLVGVLPNGKPNPENSVAGTLGNTEQTRQSALEHVVSEDGSRVFWTSNSGGSARGPGQIYVRLNPAQDQSAINGSEECIEPEKACTLAVSKAGEELTGKSQSQFWTAAADGSAVLFSTGTFLLPENLSSDADLYEFDVETKTTRPIAGQVPGVLGASEDLSRIYFVSTEALAAGAVGGEWNLYLEEKEEDEEVIRLVATLSDDDRELHTTGISPVRPDPIRRASRVTPDGSHIAFQALTSLTGYDNTDLTGKRYTEVYRYDADTDELTCVSCNPSGAPPSGPHIHFPYDPFKSPLSGGNDSFDERFGQAATLPTWEREQHGSRALSEDGNRVFFHTYEALAVRDANGSVQDVYMWEAQGTGSCVQAGGCIELISTGTSPEESEFVDASADGDDVFFATTSRIDPRDEASIDIYDARVGGGLLIPPPQPPCVGDACQSIPEPPRRVTPTGALFTGPGSQPKPNCRGLARRAAKLNRRAKRLGSTQLSRRAEALGKQAKRCRRAARKGGS